MELLTLKVTPLSHFETLPKGDTIFGQIMAYLFLNKDDEFKDYLKRKPKLIVSDMMPFGYVYQPNLPIDCFKNGNKNIDKKALRKRNFISLKNLQNGELNLCEKVDFMDEFVSIRNSINRTTFTTYGTDFAPYGVNEKNFLRTLWMFVLVDNPIKDKIIKTIKKIGKYGFGKDANIGKGNFDVEIIANTLQNIDSKYALSISPIILKDNNIEKSWYEPFTRFGKFGLQNAHANAFKKPTLLTDSGTVVKLKKKEKYFGTCCNNGFDNKISFLQGYSIAVPFELKDKICLNTK